MLVTPAGMVMLCRLVQLLKTPLSSRVMPFIPVTSVREVQTENAQVPISVTLSGM